MIAMMPPITLGAGIGRLSHEYKVPVTNPTTNATISFLPTYTYCNVNPPTFYLTFAAGYLCLKWQVQLGRKKIWAKRIDLTFLLKRTQKPFLPVARSIKF